MAIYTTRSNLETVFGKQNILRWADLDNDGNAAEISSRITYACETASSNFEDILRQRRYTFPITMSKSVIDLVTKMATLLLYDAREIIDGNSGTDALSLVRQKVEEKLGKIRRGEIILEGGQTKNVPAVIQDEELNRINHYPDPFDHSDPFHPFPPRPCGF